MLPELEHGYDLLPPPHRLRDHVKKADFESTDVEWGLRSVFLPISLAVSSEHGRAGPRLRHTLRVHGLAWALHSRACTSPSEGPLPMGC